MTLALYQIWPELRDEEEYDRMGIEARERCQLTQRAAFHPRNSSRYPLRNNRQGWIEGRKRIPADPLNYSSSQSARVQRLLYSEVHRYAEMIFCGLHEAQQSDLSDVLRRAFQQKSVHSNPITTLSQAILTQIAHRLWPGSKGQWDDRTRQMAVNMAESCALSVADRLSLFMDQSAS